MKRLLIFCSILFIGFVVIAQSKQKQVSSGDNQKPITKEISDIVNSKTDPETVKDKPSKHKKLILSKDTLILSDYMMSIDRVNDNLNSISDSSNLGFEVVRMGRKVDDITNDIGIIRKNIRGRSSAFNIKNLYLYQSFASDLNNQNDRIEARTAKIFHRVNNAKLSLKTVLYDSVFRVLYADSNLRNNLDKKLVRLERKWERTDSTTKANVDTLNVLKVKIADNAVNLSNMLNMMDLRLDRADKQLFGQEVNFLWQKAQQELRSKK